MSPLPWSLRLLDLAAGASAVALELLLQSTLIIALGLTAAWLLGGRGSAVRSAIYRATLVAVVACPAATWLISALGLSAAIDWLPSFRPTVVTQIEPASDPSNIGRSDGAAPNGALSDPTAQLSGAPPRQNDPFSSSRVGEPFGSSPQFSDVPFNKAPSVRRESNGDRRAEPPRQDTDIAVKPIPARPVGPAWVVNPAAAVLAIGIAVFWLLGSSVLFLRLLIDHWRVVGICRTASPADAGDRLLRDELAAKLGISAPRLLRSPYLSGPCLTGLWRHTILLPEESSNVPLSSVLIHELTHLRRGDSGWNLLRHAVRVVLFFQPLLWCLSRRMEEAAEEVCDDHVVHWGADRSLYADGLVRLAEQRSLPLSTVVPLVRFRSLLGRRVQRILDRSHRLSLRAGMMALCAIAAACIAVTLVVALLAPSGRSAAAPPSEAKKNDEGAGKKPEDVTKTAGSARSDGALAAANAAETPFHYRGRVVDPNGKPVVGAKLFLVYWTHGATAGETAKPHAVSDAQGSFEFDVKLSEFEAYGDEGLSSQIFAVGTGFGFAAASSVDFETTGELLKELLKQLPLATRHDLAARVAGHKPVLHLVPDDVPITGRVLTIEGHPVAGARVRVKELSFNDQGSLDSWERAAKEPKADYYSLRNHAPNTLNGPQLAAAVPDAVADSDGRFTLRSIGRERIAQLLISGPAIETDLVTARTRKGDKIVVPEEWKMQEEMRRRNEPRQAVYFGASFDHIAGPSKRFSGRITDADSGKAIPGVRISAGATGTFTISGKPYISATTDADGNYRLDGLTVGKEERIYVAPPGETEYLPAGASLTIDPDGPDPTHDFQLNRGIWVRGKVVDDRTGEPLSGRVEYFAFDDNPHLKSYLDFRRAGGYERRADRSGRFQIAVMPGPGVIAFIADDHTRFRRGHGAETLTGPFLGAGKDLTDRMFRTVPYLLTPANQELVRQIAPEPNSAPIELKLALTSGTDVVGRILAPNGKPLSGGIVSGSVYEGAWYPIEGETFRVEGYYPDRPRELFFFHQERNLAGHYLLQGQPPKDLSIRLELAGAIRGRLLDANGTPLSGVVLHGTGVPDDQSGDARLRLSTDDAGRFEIRGLIPGRKYTVDGYDGAVGRVLIDATVEAGKTKDAGDVTLQPPDTTKTLQSPPAADSTESNPKNAIKAKAGNAAESASASRNDSTRSDRKADDDLLSVNGRVLDPQGKPIAGANVAAVARFWKTWSSTITLASTKSDDSGHFHIEYHKSQFAGQSPDAWRWSMIVAYLADDSASLNWVTYGSIKPGEEVTLQLVSEEPIEGRIVDLEGRPISGVNVAVESLTMNATNDLSDWLATLRSGIPMSGVKGGPDRWLPMDYVDRWKSKTDSDGRFHLHGLGHDRVATIRISGAAIAVADVRVVTRSMEAVKVNTTSPAVSSVYQETTIYYGSHFQYAAEPSQAMEGVVRDSKTGEPLAGVGVSSSRFAGKAVVNDYKIQTVSDEHGAYRLEGMPKGEGNRVMAVPTDDQPYFMREFDVPTAPGLTPVKFDLELHRGVMIQGRVSNRVTGAAVEGAWMHFIPWPDNPNIKGMTEYGGGSMHGSQSRYQTDHDGRYRVVGLPGRGLVEISHLTGPFPPGQGFDGIKDLPTIQQFLGVAGVLLPSKNTTPAVRETQIRDTNAHVQVDFELDPGKQLTVNLVDPNGKPLTGVEVSGLWPKPQSLSRNDAGPTVDVVGLRSDEKRLILVHQKERNLGKAIRVCWKDAGGAPVTVKLEPCGTLQARLLDKNGDPVRGGSIRFDADRGDFSLQSPGGATDADGRLNYTALLPGGTYIVYCECAQTGFQTLIKNLTAAPGEIIDLGEFDVTSKDRPKPNRTSAVSSKIEPKTAVPANDKDEMRSPAADGHDDAAQPDRKPQDDVLEASGRVLDPAGKPAANADVAIVQPCRSFWKKAATLAAGKTNDAGRFRLEFRKSGFAAAGFEPRNSAALVASMSGFGVAWCDCDPAKSDQQTSLQLVADEPVEGRVVDLEGRPVAGVKVEVVSLTTNRTNDLSAWLSSLKSGFPTFIIGDVPLLDTGGGEKPDRYLEANLHGQWKSTTDGDGRFRIAGVGHDRVARIELAGGGIAIAEIMVVTRPMEPLKALSAGASLDKRLTVYYGSHFQYAAEPSQPVEGVVRDSKTGKGLSRVAVAANALAGEFHKVVGSLTTTSDESGHYRLVGMPKGPGNRILAIPADGEPYFARGFDVPTAQEFKPVTLNLDLHRGVRIQGRVTDRATGAPVEGATMSFIPWPDNPNVIGMPEFRQGAAGLWNRYLTDRDGRYKLVGLMGRGLVQVNDPTQPYPPGQGFGEIVDLPNFREFQKVQGPTMSPFADFTTAIKETRIGERDQEVRTDFELARGKRLTLNVIDTEGQPVSGVDVQGLWPRGQHLSQSNMGPTMDIEGLLPDEKRLVLLQQKNRNLGKAIRVSWKDNGPGPITVKLEPCGTLKARLMDKQGEPVHNGVIRVSVHWGKDGSLSDYDSTDSDGHMNCKGLLPGADYFVFCNSPQLAPNRTEWVIESLIVSPGETIDLGEFDVTSKDRPKLKRTNSMSRESSGTN